MAKITHDEFYTLFQDVENELKHYNFKNAVVWLPCDNSAFSSFYRYFFLNFHELGLKKSNLFLLWQTRQGYNL